ncbi:MAG: CBS domain-containing protein, partial [Cyanobacteria bacterium P01_A01_bin.83]
MCIDQYLELNPVTVAPDTSLTEASALFVQRKLKYLLVVTTASSTPMVTELKGIMTKGDLLRALATNIEPHIATVDATMTQPVKFLAKHQCQDPQVVWSYLQKQKINYLPILGKDKELLGVINSQALISFLLSKKATRNCHQNQPPNNWQQQPVEWERVFEVTPSMFCVVGFDG